MLPGKSNNSACDSESLSQSKQTSTVSIDDNSNPPSKCSKSPLSRDTSKSDKGSMTVFEFCQIIQDIESPKDITLIKDTVIEETRSHPSDKQDIESTTSSEENLTANRYKYCREVIRPYLKHSEDCPETEEELLKNVLDSVSEDFPDYQPCLEVFVEKRGISDITSSSQSYSISKVDASTSTSCTSRETMEEKKDDEKNKKSISKSTENVTAPQCPKPAEESKERLRESSSKPKCTKKKSLEETKKTCTPKSSTVRCDKEATIGVKCKKPSYYLTERCIDCESISNKSDPEPEESFIDNHSKTISTLKVAMEDFVGKVYKTTKDAVTVITTESAKQIDKVKKITTECSNTEGAKQSRENKDSDTLSSFNFFRKIDKTDTMDDDSSKPELPKVADVVDNIISKVDSTLSMLSEHLSVDKVPKVLRPRNFNDTSSPYDKPAPPKEVTNFITPTPAPIPVANNSVFAAIKEKIVSMFREEEPKPILSVSRTSTSSSETSSTAKSDESDEYFLEKVDQ